MKKIFVMLLSIFVISLGLISCSQEEDPVVSKEPSMAVKIQAVNKKFSLPVDNSLLKSATATPSLEFTAAIMRIWKLEFEAEMKSSLDQPSKEIEYEIKGATEINLFDLKADFGAIPLPEGIYEEIEFDVHFNKTKTGGEPVIYLEGALTLPDGSKIPFIFAATDNFNFKAKSKGVTISAENYTEFASLIQIHLDKMIKGITPELINKAKLTDDGALVISADSNPDLYKIIILNFRRNHYFKVKDHDDKWYGDDDDWDDDADDWDDDHDWEENGSINAGNNDTSQNPVTTPPATSTSERLSAADARKMVTDKFGGIIEKIEYTYNETNPLYKGEALKKGYKVVFEINARTKQITKWDVGNDNKWDEFAHALSSFITMEQAAAKVIEKSDLGNTFVQKIDFKYDGDETIYQGEAFNKGVKYVFELYAKSGQFKKWTVNGGDETWAKQYYNVQ